MSTNSPVHVLTFDLEDWFHGFVPTWQSQPELERRVESSTATILDLLAQHQSTATFFVLGDVARHSVGLIHRIADAGHEIGTHGQNHEFVYRQQPHEFRADLLQSIDIIQGIIGRRVTSYRAPYFSITSQSLWALDVLIEAGITLDSSIFPIRNPRYGIANAPRLPHEIRPGLREWPLSTLPTPIGNVPFCGGFYFRLLPSFAIRVGVRRLEKRGEPVVVYLHPWEFDPGQPTVCTPSRFVNFRHYLNLHSTCRKLDLLLKKNRYTSLASAEALMMPEGMR